MQNKHIRKILSLIFIFNLIFQQSGFAQMIGQLDIAKYLNQMNSFSVQDKFRPLHLRYFSYDALTNNFEILLDKGDLKDIQEAQVKEQSQQLLKYFLVGITLPDENFWVNLRPDSESQIINGELAQTDVGKILLEADLQLKKDTATFTSPETPEGRAYWNKLYQKAGQLFGTDNVTIPTLTRPWIVPQEVIIRETADSAYIYKATLKVMLEQDHLKNSADYNFKDERLKELNEYSSQLIRENIIPKLTKEVNTSKKYASLRQVFYSLILSRWFKARFSGKSGLYPELINKHNLNGLTSQEPWSKTTYFKEYQKSFQNGEYNIKEAVTTLTGGQVIRSYFSGGADFTQKNLSMPNPTVAASPIGTFRGRNPIVDDTLRGHRMVGFSGRPGEERHLSDLSPARPRIASSPLQIRTELTVPEGQKKEFFTTDYHEYTLATLFKKPVEQIPDEIVNAIRQKLDPLVAEKKLKGAEVKDFGGADIDILVTHSYGELNAAVQRLMLEAFKQGAIKAQELGLLRDGIDINNMSLRDLAEATMLRRAPHSINERGAEVFMVAKIIGGGIGAGNIKLFHMFFIEGATPLKKLGFLVNVNTKEGDKPIVRGVRAVVRRTGDVLKGNYNGPSWVYENSSAAKIDGKKYKSRYDGTELMIRAGQPNDYVITAIYPVEGSALPSNEPLVTVAYQPVYGTKGELLQLNPTFLCRSQSGADAVAAVAGAFHEPNPVPGGPDGGHFVITRPASLEEARMAPKEGFAHTVVYGWMSKGYGRIPRETDGIIGHLEMNPPAYDTEKRLADRLAAVFTTHKKDQPYVAPHEAEKRVLKLRQEQSRFFRRAPKEADADPLMAEIDRMVESGQLIAFNGDKADMGGKKGHNYTPEYMLAIDRATAIHAQEKGRISYGNIVGFVDNMQRLRNGTTNSIGDDSHIITLGDRSRNSLYSHDDTFTAFTRGYLASMVGNDPGFDPTKPLDSKNLEHAEKPYGRAQDFAGKEAKAAMDDPYGYSKFDERFFEILRDVMPLDYMQMVDNLYRGWKHRLETGQKTVKLAPTFSGNVSNQGMGSYRYIVDSAAGEREVGLLLGDKMGPAGLNRIIREAVYSLLGAIKTGSISIPERITDAKERAFLQKSIERFKNGAVFEIWDTKAFDEHGNIPIDELPDTYGDIAESIPNLKDKAEADFVVGAYYDGMLKKDLSREDKLRLAELLKKSGYVPTKRILLDAEENQDAIERYLLDSDRFVIKAVWSKQKAGWDIENPEAFLYRPMLGSTVTKLGLLAEGAYIGKDDPGLVAHILLFAYISAFLRDNYVMLQGDMNGSHWLAAIVTAFKNAAANKESHPILVGFRYRLSEDGLKVEKIDDVFDAPEYEAIRQASFEFNREFKKATLDGAFEPYTTNVRTVENAYPLAKALRQLNHPRLSRPFLWKYRRNDYKQRNPIGMQGEVAELFKVATAAASSPMTADQEVAPKTKVAINGFGRIGKLALKAHLEQNLAFDIVAVNDLDPIGSLAHLFKHDSTFGEFKGEVNVEGDNLIINGRRIKVLSEKDPAKLPWKELGVDIVIESTGRFTKRQDASKHLEAGAKRVVISAPGEDEDISVVLGVNEERYDPEKHKIISNVSCTTNCLAPVAKVLHQTFGMESGQMETTHATTNDQLTLDGPHKDRRRARATIGNMIPTTTGAARVIGKIIPELQGKLDGWAMRVPTADVSAVYLVAWLKKDTTVEEVNAALKKAAAEGRLSKYLAYTEEQLVSSDFLRNPKSAIVDASLTRVTGGRLVGVVAWYDNEWGYSNRLVELVDYIIAREPVATSSPVAPEDVGGIDFRVINMITQPMGNFAGLNFTLPKLSHLENIDLDEELSSIQKMLNAGIMPSGERLKEYVAACYQKGVSGKYIDGIINFLVDICRMQEEEISATPDDIKALLLVVDSR